MRLRWCIAKRNSRKKKRNIKRKGWVTIAVKIERKEMNQMWRGEYEISFSYEGKLNKGNKNIKNVEAIKKTP